MSEENQIQSGVATSLAKSNGDAANQNATEQVVSSGAVPAVPDVVERNQMVQGMPDLAIEPTDLLLAQADAKPHVYDDLMSDGRVKGQQKDEDEEQDTAHEGEHAQAASGDAGPASDSGAEGSSSESGVAEALQDDGSDGFSLPTLGWVGLGLAAVGVAVAAGGDDGVPPPSAPTLALGTDTGVAGDNVTSVADFTVAGLDVDPETTWEYSSDGGVNWVAGQGSGFQLAEAGDYNVVVRQTVGEQTSESSAAISVTVDPTAAAIESLASDSASQTIVLTYDGNLLESNTPAASAFTVRQGGIELVVDSVSVSGMTATLNIASGLAAGSLQVSYAAPADAASGLQDYVGNSTVGFSQIVVSDGYIRGAEVYLDANADGVADASERLADVSSNSHGEILVEGAAAAGELIIMGGVNTDTGAINELSLSAPAGYSVVNPLTTLVAEVINNASDPAQVLTVAEAESQVQAALGVTLAEGESLSSYDPLSDTSEAALANRIVTAQIATVLVIAATSQNDAEAESKALANFADLITENAALETPVVIAIDASAVASVLSDDLGVSLVSAEQLTDLQDTVAVMETATSIDDVVTAQAEAVDKVAAAAPTGVDLQSSVDLGVSDSDDITSATTLTMEVSFNTSALDGTAVIEGDLVEVSDASGVIASGTVSSSDVTNDAISLTTTSPVAEGDVSLTASITDAAGNVSAPSSALVVTVDTTAPMIAAGDMTVAENTGAGTVVGTVGATDAGDGITYTLKAGGDAGLLAIDETSGAVTLTPDPDYETASSYDFTVVATDAAGNASEQGFSLAVTNLDEVAPSITSGGVAASIDENSGVGQTIYTATATDSADISDGVTYSIASGTGAGLTINPTSGVVTLTDDPDYETAPSYDFTVVATDGALNTAEQAVSLMVGNLDEVAPTITSAETGLVVEGSGAGNVVYTVMADDTQDISTGAITYSLAAGSDAALTIDSATGAVTLADDPQKDVTPTYNMSVIATDAAGNVSTPQAVVLTVDVAPLITSGAMASVNENAGASQTVYTVVASDSGDPNAVITYDLKAGSDPALTIDSATGVVTLSDDPDYETQSSYTFIATATDAAGNAGEKAITLSINNLDEVAPTLTSPASVAAINENSGGSQIVYTATSTDSADASDGVTYSLAAGSSSALAINAASGAVTLTGSPDYETAPSYDFTVVVTDGAGLSDEQVLALSVNNLDEAAPTITSDLSASVTDYQSLLYTVVADDSTDTSAGITFALKAGVGDANLLSIDETTGAVSLASGVTSNADKASYTFTVQANDGVNAAAEQSVTVVVSAPIDVKGPGATVQGPLVPELVQNDDGTAELTINLSDSAKTEYRSEFDLYKFIITFDGDELGGVAGAPTDTQGTAYVTRPNPDSYEIFQVDSVNIDGYGTNFLTGELEYTPMDVDLPLVVFSFSGRPEGVTNITIKLEDVELNQSGAGVIASTIFTFAEAGAVQGTAADDVFHLLGGSSAVTGGTGADIFVVTEKTGTSQTITDFEAGVDGIEMSALAVSKGYTSGGNQSGSANDLVVSKLGTVPADIATLITGNDTSLDNAVGAYFDDATDVLTVFIDSDSAAGAVQVTTLEITLTNQSSFDMADLDLTSAAFIA